MQTRARYWDAQGAPTTVLLPGDAGTLEGVVEFLGVIASGRCAAMGDPQWPAGVARAVAGRLPLGSGAPAASTPQSPFYIGFTSGSTGAPKGVCLSRDGLLDTARAVHERLADLPLERHLAVLPLALLLENVAGVYAPLLRGMPVHLPPLAELGWAGMQGFDPAALDRKVKETGAGSVILVPELLKASAA